MLPHRAIEQRLQHAFAAVLPGVDSAAIQVRPCTDPKFGDYQCTSAMALAKARKMNPRQLVTDALAKLDMGDLCEKVDIAGAGFINFHLKKTALENALADAVKGEHLFHEKATQPRTIVIDFSSPNVAKPMHVGHIRSTILGDCLARAFRLLGHRVVTDNHIGDWGTQFGMLLTGWKTLLDPQSLAKDPIAELERIYKAINAQCDPDKPGFDQAMLDRARGELVKLQAGDAENLGIWKLMIALSQQQFDTIYGRLGVTFDHALGESFYNPRLPAVVDDLVAKGLARESEGAKAVFSDGSVPPKEDPYLVQRDGEWAPNPQLIQKGDGGFNYSTTDLATLAYRLETWRPDEIIYVTDSRQQLHFRQLFATFRRWHPEAKVRLEHVWFGTILGGDGRPLKTRSGDTVKLADLLDEAEERAFALVKSKQLERPEGERLPEHLWPEIARVVGVGSVKYADLLPNRQSDYQFIWEKMLAFNGNTAPYLQYAYARIRSIFRKAAGAEVISNQCSVISLDAPEELALAKHLLNFGLVLEAVAEECRPNYLCNYLYELAGHFTRFYENCPVLKAEGAQRGSRLALCEVTARVLKQGLNVLGIETTEQM